MYSFQFFPVTVKLAAMKFIYWFMVVGIAEVLVWLARVIVS
jgi:hypothetical protein